MTPPLPLTPCHLKQLRELPRPLTSCSAQEMGPVPCLDSAAELPMVRSDCGPAPMLQEMESCPTTHLIHGSMSRAEITIPATSHPLMPETGGEAGPEVVRAGGLPLLLTSYSTQKSDPIPHLGSTVKLALTE